MLKSKIFYELWKLRKYQARKPDLLRNLLVYFFINEKGILELRYGKPWVDCHLRTFTVDSYVHDTDGELNTKATKAAEFLMGKEVTPTSKG